MKLACFAMLRNEAAILGPYLDQMEAFFDHVTLVDHESTDDSVEIIRSRSSPAIDLLHMKAPGYPQSALATLCARRILTESEPDFLFMLDCDEFLPFGNRDELEAFLRGADGYDVLVLPWLNVRPVRLDGGNIFSAPFLRPAKPSARYGKVVLSRRLAPHPEFTVCQGYHLVLPPSGTSLRTFEAKGQYICHIPIQSRTQFYFKVAAGARQLQDEHAYVRLNLGEHWVRVAREFAMRPLSDGELTDIVMHYSDEPPDAGEGVRKSEPCATLDFAFPYVRSPYAETAESVSGQIRNLLRQFTRPEVPHEPGSFVVTNDAHEVLFSSGGPIRPARAARSAHRLPSGFVGEGFAECYASLIDPLFNLPAKLPRGARAGHIPFLFVLFRAMRPDSYVELGVHTGTSLIAAATAAATYRVATTLIGIDTWQGDEQAGKYKGDSIYHELRTYLGATFPAARLERSFLSDALPRFATGSIDVLNINGPQTYDAVKKEFTSWFDRVSSSGVILLHDISVFDRGCGVHALWSELKEHYTTLEFPHSCGLGVVLMAPDDERLHPFSDLARDPETVRWYQSVVADVARVLPERMDAYTPPQRAASEVQATIARLASMEADLAAARREIASVYSSTSWRVSAPVRAMGRLLKR